MYHQPVTPTALGTEIDIFLAAWGAQFEIMMLAHGTSSGEYIQKVTRLQAWHR